MQYIEIFVDRKASRSKYQTTNQVQPATTEAYRTLDLEPGADLGSVRQAYRLLVKVWHPDRFAHDPKLQAFSDEKLKDINASYEAIVTYLATGWEEKNPP